MVRTAGVSFGSFGVATVVSAQAFHGLANRGRPVAMSRLKNVDSGNHI